MKFLHINTFKGVSVILKPIGRHYDYKITVY